MKVLDQSGQPKVLPADFIPFIPRVQGTASALQSIPNNANTGVLLDGENFDTDTMHDLVTNTSRITIKTSGVYFLHGRIFFAGSAAGNRQATFRKNGGSIAGIANQQPGVAAGNIVEITHVAELVAGDYIELGAYQDSGGALNINGGVIGLLEAIFIGPGFQSVRAKAQVFYVTPAQFAALTPVDGDEAYVIIDAAAGVIWHMRYNAGSASAYKWEFLGGADLTQDTLLGGGFPFSGFTQIGATGWFYSNSAPKFTAPRAGQYQVRWNASLHSVLAAGSQFSFGIGNVTASVAPIGNSRRDVHTPSNPAEEIPLSEVIATCASGDVIVPLQGTGSASSWGDVFMSVKPVRIS